MHSKNDSLEIMINNEADEVINEVFDSLKNRHQNDLKPRKVTGFGFDYFHLFYYKFQEKKCKLWWFIQNQKATINPISKKDKWFNSNCIKS